MCRRKKTDLGEAAFKMVHKFMNPAEGHAGGNFKKSWALMTRGHEKKDISSISTLKQDYYKLEMEEDELPSLFIMKMEKMRVRLLNDATYIKTDDEFMLDVIAKLPKGNDGELGPYQVGKRTIEPKIKRHNNSI